MSNRTEYEKTNTVGFYIKLNKKTDADIIEALETCSNKQGLVKRLIRDYIRDENQAD